MKAILLARVSSKKQEDGQSIPAQEHRLREYAAFPFSNTDVMLPRFFLMDLSELNKFLRSST